VLGFVIFTKIKLTGLEKFACKTLSSLKKNSLYTHIMYSRNVMDVNWGLVVKLALPAKVTRRANKVIGIYDRSH
jgi:hypothetical protein